MKNNSIDFYEQPEGPDKYLILLQYPHPVFMKLERCPACDGSGKVDPNAVLGGRDVPGAGVCPICDGERNVSTVIDVRLIPLEMRQSLIRLLQHG